MTDVYEDRGMDKEEAPKNNLPDWKECRLRVENSRWFESENMIPCDDSYVANPLHEFIYEYDDTDKHKSSWWMHRLELLIDWIRQESTEPLIAEIENLRAYINDPGYVRVPVEPTEAMINAAVAAIDEMEMNTATKADAAYFAMLSASKGEK